MKPETFCNVSSRRRAGDLCRADSKTLALPLLRFFIRRSNSALIAPIESSSPFDASFMAMSRWILFSIFVEVGGDVL